MKNLKQIMDTEYDTGIETFDAGTRKLIIKLSEKGVRVRVSRQPVWRFVSYQRLYDIGAMDAADFNASPRTGRIRRGAVS